STAAPATPYAFRSQTVAAWHFDETGGTKAADASGFGNDGTLSAVVSGSTPAFVSGQTGLGDAVSFPGLTGSVMTVPNSASLSGTGDISVEAWVNPSAVVQVNGAGLVVKGTGGAETFMLDIASDAALTNRWRFGVRGGGTLYAVMSTQSVRSNGWTHLAGVYASGAAPSLSLYVDGALTRTTTNAPASRDASAAPLSVGSRQSAASDYDLSYKGLIDEVHVETAALSAAQAGSDYTSAQPATVTPPAPNDGVRLTVPPNAFGGNAVILLSSSPLTVPITVSPAILSDGLAAPPTGQTLVPGSLFEVVANVGGAAFTGSLGSTVTLAIPYPDADDNGLVDGTSPPIPASSLKVYTLNTAVTRWDVLPSSVDTANKRVLGQTPHFSIFALFGPTGIKPNTDQVRLYPRPWKPGSGGRFDSATFNGRSGLAIDNLPSSGIIRIFTLSGQLVTELGFNGSNAGTVIWDGTNQGGRKVASGVYFAYVKGDDGSSNVIKFAVER
ncbi:MAG: hypothetical protein KGL53_09105, partial [Elusimicrobia bacterium]|nr:hypothetical protein [Elusimicrobiota bacterium]